MADGIPGRRPGRRWLLAAVAVAALAALIAVPLIVMSARHRAAALVRYGSQLRTVTSRLGAEEFSLYGQPPAAPASPRGLAGNLPSPQLARADLSWVADSISGDRDLRGAGPLRVSVGAGSVTSVRVKPRAGGGWLEQIAYSVTVTSPYASTRIAVWAIGEASPAGAYQDLMADQGECVLSSTLLGPGPARTNLDLGGGRSLAWCRSAWLASGPLTEDLDPRLGLAGISPS